MANLLVILGAALAAAAAVGLLIRRRHRARQRQRPRRQTARREQLRREQARREQARRQRPRRQQARRQQARREQPRRQQAQQAQQPWIVRAELDSLEDVPLPLLYSHEGRGTFEDDDWEAVEPPAEASERIRIHELHELLEGFDIQAQIGEATLHLQSTRPRELSSYTTYDLAALLAELVDRLEQTTPPHLPSAFEHDPVRSELLKAIAHESLSNDEASAAAPYSAQSIDQALAMLFIRLGPPPKPSETGYAPASNGDGGARQ